MDIINHENHSNTDNNTTPLQKSVVWDNSKKSTFKSNISIDNIYDIESALTSLQKSDVIEQSDIDICYWSNL